MLLETKEMDGNGKVSSKSSGKEMSEIWNPMDSAQRVQLYDMNVVRPERNNRSVCKEHGVTTTSIPMWECLQSRTPQKRLHFSRSNCLFVRISCCSFETSLLLPPRRPWNPVQRNEIRAKWSMNGAKPLRCCEHPWLRGYVVGNWMFYS